MKNKGFIYTLMIIIIAGLTITLGTSRAIEKSRRQHAAETVMTLAETEIPGARTETMVRPDETVAESAVLRAASAPDSGASVFNGEAGKPVGPMEAAEEEAAADMDKEAGPGAAVPEAQTAVGPGMNGSADPVGVDGKTVPMSPLAPASPMAESRGKTAGPQEAVAEAAGEESSYYLNRLRELDVQIQRNREKQSASNNYSAKKQAESELKLWDSERSSIYGEIMERLDVSQASGLVDEEREWMKERDRRAAEAAKSSAGGSMESVEYTLSLAESARSRSYELIENYGYLLSE